MTSDKEITERRKGKLSATGDILSGKGGRKVFSGIWVIIMANVWFGVGIYLSSKDRFIGLSEKGYLILTVLSILLIGFGTILDTFVGNLGQRIVDVIGARVGVLANKIDKVEVTNNGEPASTPPQS